VGLGELVLDDEIRFVGRVREARERGEDARGLACLELVLGELVLGELVLGELVLGDEPSA
jgi:hypothetical protein